MTKMFSKLSTENLVEAEDRLGGGAGPVETDAYEATIKVAYAGKAASSDSSSITVVLDLGKQEFRETLWITTKTGDNFYVDKQDPTKKHPLPGYTTIDDLCLLATGEDLSEQETAKKVVKIYNFDERKEVPTEVDVLTGLTGKKVKVGVLREIVAKQKKNDAGVYVDTAETRTQNTIDKVFHAETGRTVNEYRHEVETPEFLTAWLERNKGKDRNKVRNSTAEGGAGQAGSGKPGDTGGARKKLFGK